MKIIILLVSMFTISSCATSKYDPNILSKADGSMFLNTRPEVRLRVWIYKPENPVASVILFRGGGGKIKNIDRDGNFLVRHRELFLEQNLLVAVIDAPSDMRSGDGTFNGFRTSKDHVTDVDKLISYVRKQASVPLWLVGISRGTESATHIAINSKKNPYGLVLLNSVTEPTNNGTSVLEQSLDKILMPTLLASDVDDGCRITPTSGAKEIADDLVNVKVKTVKMFSGSSSVDNNECTNRRTHHNFFEIEDEVVDYIANFIKSN